MLKMNPTKNKSWSSSSPEEMSSPKSLPMNRVEDFERSFLHRSVSRLIVSWGNLLQVWRTSGPEAKSSPSHLSIWLLNLSPSHTLPPQTSPLYWPCSVLSLSASTSLKTVLEMWQCLLGWRERGVCGSLWLLHGWNAVYGTKVTTPSLALPCGPWKIVHKAMFPTSIQSSTSSLWSDPFTLFPTLHSEICKHFSSMLKVTFSVWAGTVFCCVPVCNLNKGRSDVGWR